MGQLNDSIYVDSDTLIELDGLKDPTDDQFINGATVTYQLFEKDKTTSITLAVAMAYVAASDGIYRGTLPDSTALVEGCQYWLKVTAVDTGRTLVLCELVIAKCYNPDA